MQLKKNISEQKLRGAYYTPSELARAMVAFATKRPYSSILEPSCGDGIFIDHLYRQGLPNGAHVTAIEIESPEAAKVNAKFKNEQSLDSILCPLVLIFSLSE